ncbi:MAG: tetratricopeptide repeat protein, partial [Chloroflexota bacterium]
MADESPADPGRFFARVLADQHYQKGLQLEQQGEWHRALLSYRRACSLAPNRVLYLLARGHVCQTHGLEPEAEECYRVALDLRPDDTVVLYNQAQLFAARGQLEEARTNLAKIVAGGTDTLGDRAAPIFSRLGDIALRREDYTAAAIHFRRALECAPDHRYAMAALGGLERFAEFASPFDPVGGIHPKVAVYGYAGAMLLGLAGDDGITIPAYPGLGFDSLAELAQTLARFAGLARHFRWSFDVVTPLDPESQPLAIALATALEARLVAAVEATPRGACTLGVTGAGSEPALASARALALREQAGRSLLYAVGLTRPVWEYAPVMQVVSAPNRLEFPWNRSEASAAEHAEAFGAELGELLKAAPPDPTVEAQVRWYAPPGGHARLSFDPHTLE